MAWTLTRPSPPRGRLLWPAAAVVAAACLLGCPPEEEPPGHILWVEGEEDALQYPWIGPEEFEADPVARTVVTTHEPRHEDIEIVVDWMQLEPGMVVADVGSGSGFYTFEIAQRVGPTGRVYALDLNRVFLDNLRYAGASRELNPHDNVVPVNNVATSTTLPPETLDLAFVSHLNHLMYRPLGRLEDIEMLYSLAETVRPGGHVLVIQFCFQFEGTQPRDVVPLVTDPREALRLNFESAGLILEAHHEFEGEDTVMYRFGRPEQLPWLTGQGEGSSSTQPR